MFRHILVLLFVLISTSLKGQEINSDDIYQLIQSLSPKHKDDSINQRPFLALSTKPTLGPWLKAKEYYKPFENNLSEADIDFMVKQAASPNVQYWNQEQLNNFTVVDPENHLPEHLYFIEVPVFSKDKKSAIVKIQYYCGNVCVYQCWHLYQKTEKGWNRIRAEHCIEG